MVVIAKMVFTSIYIVISCKHADSILPKKSMVAKVKFAAALQIRRKRNAILGGDFTTKHCSTYTCGLYFG